MRTFLLMMKKAGKKRKRKLDNSLLSLMRHFKLKADKIYSDGEESYSSADLLQNTFL